MDIFAHKEVTGALAAALELYCYYPYYRGILKGETKPHVFTWFLWGLLGAIACAAQFNGNAGPGAWATGVASLGAFGIALIAFRQGEKHITRSDRVSFMVALSAIPLWYFTKNPVWSVALVTLIDALAFYPTFRKSWLKPGQEVISTYVFSVLQGVLALVSMIEISFVTSFYPASLVLMNGLFVITLLWRRRVQAHQKLSG